ncbi:MAG: type II secretion system protein [Pontiella sp.]
MKRGFTLIEILLALLVVSMGMVSIMGVLASTLNTNRKIHADLHIVSFADMVLNHLHATENWHTLPTAGTMTLVDYNETETTITLGSTDQFHSKTIGKNGLSLERFTVTYRLDTAVNGNTFTATLQVWPGFSAMGKPAVFQTERYNWQKNP